MTKRYYITIEIEADMPKDLPVTKQRGFLYDYINSTKRVVNNDFYMQRDTVLTLFNEKGEWL